LIDQSFNDSYRLTIITIPNLAILLVNEFGNVVEHGQLTAAFQMDKQQFDILKFIQLSFSELEAFLRCATIEDMLSSRFLSKLVSQSLLEEVVKLHEGLMYLAFSFTHG
jgi:hypothetical protein